MKPERNPPPRLRLRPATDGDAELLLRWRNHPEVRRASRNTHLIAEDEHRRWLASVLSDPARWLLVAELDSVPVGQARFDDLGGERFEISVSVEPERAGAGLGSWLIESAVEKLRSQHPGAVVIAEVRRENERSRRAFEAAGFVAERTPAVAVEGTAGDFLRLHSSPSPAARRRASKATRSAP